MEKNEIGKLEFILVVGKKAWKLHAQSGCDIKIVRIYLDEIISEIVGR